MDGHTFTGNFDQIIGTEGLNFVTIGDLKWLQGAEFIRGGPDLILSGKRVRHLHPNLLVR